MKKFLIKMGLSILFLMLFSIRFLDVTVGESMVEHPLETAWKTTGIKLKSVSSESWLKVNDHGLTLYQLQQLAGQISKKLNLKNHTDLTLGEEKGFTYLSFEGMQPDRTVVTVTLQSSKGIEGQPETQLGLYTVNSGNIKNLRCYIGNLSSSIHELAQEVNFSVLLDGDYQGKLTASVVKELTGKVFRKLDARIVASHIRKDGSMSKGYTPLLKETDRSLSKPINLVISTIYDSARKVTEVIVASPTLNWDV